MKKRKGFVANSSSATYIVTLPISEERLFTDILSQMGWSYFCPTTLTKELNKRREHCEKFISETKEKVSPGVDIEAEGKNELPLNGLPQEEAKTRLHCHWIINEQERLKNIDALIAKLAGKTELDHELAREFLWDYYRVSLQVREESVVLSYFTAMHNSYDDMSPIMSELVLYYEMETDIRPKCKIEEDSMFDRFNLEEDDDV